MGIITMILMVVISIGYLVSMALGYRAMSGYHQGEDYGPVVMFLIALLMSVMSTLGVIILLISLVVNWVANLP